MPLYGYKGKKKVRMKERKLGYLTKIIPLAASLLSYYVSVSLAVAIVTLVPRPWTQCDNSHGTSVTTVMEQV